MIRRLIVLIGGGVAVFLLGGCASSKLERPAVHERVGRPRPKPVELVALPIYGSEKKEYDASSHCFVLDRGRTSMTEVNNFLRNSLKERGYALVEMGTLNTAEERSSVQKILSVESCLTRSSYLPQSESMATDCSLVVSVQNSSDPFIDSAPRLRYFMAQGRWIAKKGQQGGSQLAVMAIEVAVNNLFAVDPFRRALEPGEE